MKIGNMLSLGPREILQRKMNIYSGPGKNIHTDVEEARKAGLPGTVAQGLMFIHYITEMLTREFGESWFEGGELTVSFKKIVRPGESIKTLGRVREFRKNKVVLDIWCEKENGEITLKGEAIIPIG